MLRSINSFIGYTLLATDGEFGRVDDMFFDDKMWSTAYLLAKIGTLFGRKKVLLPPTTLGRPDWATKLFPVAYSSDQIEHCPAIETIGAAGPKPPDSFMVEHEPHLRSAREIMHYQAQSIDGKLCHVRDLIVDDLTWAIRFLVVEAANRLRARKVIVSPAGIRDIIPPEEKLYMDFTTSMIQSSPNYDPSTPVNYEYAPRQYDYLGRPAGRVI